MNPNDLRQKLFNLGSAKAPKPRSGKAPKSGLPVKARRGRGGGNLLAKRQYRDSDDDEESGSMPVSESAYSEYVEEGGESSSSYRENSNSIKVPAKRGRKKGSVVMKP